MPLLSRLASLRDTLFRRERLEEDLDAELRAAILELTETHVAAGMSRAEARTAAVAALGGVANVKDAVRDVRIGAALETWIADVVYGVRSLRRSASLTVVVVLTLGLGLAANTAIFALVRALLVHPLAYPDASRLMFVWLGPNQVGYRGPMAGSDFRDLRNGTTTVADFAGIWAPGTITLTGGGDPEQLRGAFVTTNFFDVLQVRPALGRGFRADDRRDGTAVIVLGWDLFQRRFNGDPSIVGRTIAVNDQATTVIGIMPKDFRLLLPEDAGVPDRLQAFAPFFEGMEDGPRGNMFLRVVARLRDGATIQAAADEISGVGVRIAQEMGPGRTRVFTTVGLADDAVREIRRPLGALFAGVAILLLIAAVNVAGLLVARTLARGRELHVRLALGASRLRVMRLFFIEALLLTSIAGLLGVSAGGVALRLLLFVAPDSLVRFQAATIDGPVVAALIAACVAIALLLSIVLQVTVFAQVPVRVGRLDPRGGLSRRSKAIRRALVIVQVAMSAALLVGAGLLARGFIEVLRVNPGFRAEGRLTFRLSLPAFDTPERFNAFADAIAREIGTIPGVVRVGAMSHLPYDDLPNWSLTFSDTSPLPPGSPSADSRAISAGLFDTLAVAPLDGRLFTDADNDARAPVVVIDERLARTLWPGGSAVGRTLHTTVAGMNAPIRNPAALTVIGVVPHLRLRSLVEDLRPLIFMPWRIAQRNPTAYVVETTRDPVTLAADIRPALARVDSRLAMYDVRPLGDYVEQARAVRRFTALLVAAFAALALGLTLVGVYGMLMFSVQQQRREIGVRRAIGASAGRIVRLVAGEGMLLAVAGCAIGLLAAAQGSRWLESQLYGVPAHDPATFALSGLAVLLAASITSLLSACRAAAIAPVEAFRT